MAKQIEIREVDGIEVGEIVARLNGGLWLYKGSRWVTAGGGYVGATYHVSPNREVMSAPRALVSESPLNGGVASPLTRAIMFNAGRNSPQDAFLSDPRVSRVWNAMEAMEAGDEGRPPVEMYLAAA